MAFSGHPIKGDRKYGSQAKEEGKSISLWSAALSFMHPVKKERMEFKIDPPSNFVDGDFRDQSSEFKSQ